MAAGEGRLQLVKLLLDHGADPAAVDNRGNTGAGEVSGQPLKTLATKNQDLALMVLLVLC